MPKAQALADLWLTRGQAIRLKITQVLPATIVEIRALTGYSLKSVEHHLRMLQQEGIVGKTDDYVVGRTATYTMRNPNVPQQPRRLPVQAKPRRTFEIDTPYKTRWVGGNPYEKSQSQRSHRTPA
jgi:hypothetical protein